MLDDLRAARRPTEEEKAWMATNPSEIAGRIVLMLAVSIMIGVTASQLLGAERPADVAVVSSR